MIRQKKDKKRRTKTDKSKNWKSNEKGDRPLQNVAKGKCETTEVSSGNISDSPKIFDKSQPLHSSASAEKTLGPMEHGFIIASTTEFLSQLSYSKIKLTDSAKLAKQALSYVNMHLSQVHTHFVSVFVLADFSIVSKTNKCLLAK